MREERRPGPRALRPAGREARGARTGHLPGQAYPVVMETGRRRAPGAAPGGGGGGRNPRAGERRLRQPSLRIPGVDFGSHPETLEPGPQGSALIGH